MAEQTNDWTVDFGRIASRARRRWRVILATVLVVAAVAVLAGALMPRQFSATSSVSVSPIRISSSYSAQDVNISTERTVLATREVASIAAKQLGDGVTPELLMQSSSVAAPSGSDVLQVTVDAATPQQAADRANGLATAYLRFRAQGALEAAQPSIDALEQRIAATSSRSPSLVDLRAQLTTLQHVGDGTARVIGRADAASATSASLGLPVYFVGGLFGGLILGFVLALVRDAGDRRVRFGARLSELVGTDVIALTGAHDLEGARWIARAVVRRSRTNRPAVAAVVGAGGASTDELLIALQELVDTTDGSIEVVPADRVLRNAFDRDQRPDTEFDPAADLVLIDAQHVTSGAQRAVLGDEADVVIVVADARTRVKDALETFRTVRQSDARIIATFLRGTKDAERGDQTARTAAVPAPGDRTNASQRLARSDA